MTGTIPETTIQQVLFEVESPYLGHPYFVTGHALYSALARRVDERTRRALCVSHGVFLPGEYGSYPEAHSKVGPAGSMGKELQPVESYADLFLFRDPAQRWLLDSRPRDAHNVHDLQRHGDRVAFAPKCWFGRPSHVRNTKRSVSWYLHCYLHAGRGGDDERRSIIPVAEAVLDGLRVGGARNYGFGKLSVVDSQTVALETLDTSRLETTADAGEAFRIEVLTPYVLDSEYPGADAQSIPWWWDANPSAVDDTADAGADAEATDEEPASRLWPETTGGLRRRETRLVVGGESHRLETVDHGQVVRYAGDEPLRTAINGVLRVGTHAKYGFGEFRVRPADEDRVPARASASGGDARGGGAGGR